MKPTVGRIVHYYDRWHGAEDRVRGPIAAIITAVDEIHGDIVVSLTLFDEDATIVETRTHVKQSEEPTSFHWQWPPRV